MILDKTSSRKNASQLAEELEATGQESEEKAAKWVIEKEKTEEAVRQQAEDKDQDILAHKRKYKKNDYFVALYNLAKRKISEYDINPGYNVDVILKDDGRIIFGLQKVGFRWYAKGMKICGEPKYDINCVERMVIQLFIALDELGNQHENQKTNSGIILPKHKPL